MKKKCLIQSCKGKNNCLQHCPCDCHKQFCDCYEHDFRMAVIKLAQIVDKQHINDSIKTTASMYLKAEQDINVQKYIRHLENQIDQAKLSGGITQALAERERIFGIIEPYLKHSSHNPYDKCLDEIIKEIKI